MKMKIESLINLQIFFLSFQVTCIYVKKRRSYDGQWSTEVCNRKDVYLHGMSINLSLNSHWELSFKM